MDNNYKDNFIEKHFSFISIMTTSLCNLKCSYCYICKDNGVLAKLDKEIEKKFSDGSYITQIKNDFTKEDIENIEQIQWWGGETTLFLHRATNNLEQFYELFPKLYRFFISSNFVSPRFNEEIELYIRKLEEMSDKYGRKMYLELQMSVDGPEEINDKNRGKGVTKKLLENYNKLLNLKFDKSKVDLLVITKPTLSVDTFYYFDSKEKVIEYYKFFNDNLYLPYLKQKEKYFNLILGIPNYAEPYSYTKEDGKTVAKIFEYMEEVGKENLFEGFKDTSLVPYAFLASRIKNIESNNPICGGGCGQLVGAINLGVNGGYSVCHRGFFDGFLEYAKIHNTYDDENYTKNLAKNSALVTVDNSWTMKDKKEMFKYRGLMNIPYNKLSNTKRISYKVIIQLYAYCDLVDRKYKDDEEAIKATNFFINKSSCIQDSLESVGSLYISQGELIKLILNGGLDVIYREADRLKQIREKKD